MSSLSPQATFLVIEFNKSDSRVDDPNKISVNPVVAEVATWYEKIRNAMDYKEEEVILRSAIERILKRRLLTSSKGKEVAPPLVRELIWARYFPDSSVPEAIIEKIENSIDLHIKFHDLICKKHKKIKLVAYEWLLHLLSSDIENILSPSGQKHLVSNFMFGVFKNKVTIVDEDIQTRDAQVFIAVRRAFAKEDLALLRYHLFELFFGPLNKDNVELIADTFFDGYTEINKQLNYHLKDKIYAYVKRQTPPFFILEDVLKKYQDNLSEVISDKEMLASVVMNACSTRYKDILTKVQRAVVRSIIFIFITKTIFALAVEASVEEMLYGHVVWASIAANIVFSPLLMIFAAAFIKTPDRKNSNLILEKIKTLLFDPNPSIANPLKLQKNANKVDPYLSAVFSVLWLIALLLGLSIIISILSYLQFNVISQLVFVFFLMIVSFLSYRINQTAKIYTVTIERHGFRAVLFDFFFTPFIYIGRSLTKGMSQVNIFLFIFDFLIETPFKEMFAFFEQWFLYLKSQRETLE